MKYTFTPKLNKKNMVQSFALQTLVPIYNITFFDRKESYTKNLSERNSIRTKIVTLDLSPTNSRCSNNVGLFTVSRTFLAHSVMYGQKKVKAGDIIYKGIYLRSTLRSQVVLLKRKRSTSRQSLLSTRV